MLSDRNQPEKKITLDDYLQRVLPQPRIQKGREMLALHASALGPLSRQTGVPASIIIALWGMESSFSKIQGREDVISALATLAFEGRREAFFRQELFAALKIVDGGHIELDKLKGSWAGAMGQTQFMPSSYLKYAVDGDEDGKADIWASLPDVFASTANYLHTEGWQPGIGWGREVKLPAGFPLESAGLKDSQARTAHQWKVRGVTQPDGTPLKEIDNPTWIIIPDDLQGRAFMVNANFRTLMHWNRSLYFALSIGLMSDEITSLSL
ncbi:membrane-bound lytic murein transglycosylase B [Biostraticola tofi]|uniref:Membrane-bound lytic murein transglycosylase B n=1 Tax=Biostraticola tofi TaxID=466109 RepID=A0A4R3Z4H9_9GAMM|nr:membrane-bound lytic murein transglycosylase B [Biostraticola tofi]